MPPKILPVPVAYRLILCGYFQFECFCSMSNVYKKKRNYVLMLASSLAHHDYPRVFIRIPMGINRHDKFSRILIFNQHKLHEVKCHSKPS